MFGLIQGPADAIAPASASERDDPTIVLENGKLRYSSVRRGARIISTVANIFLSASQGGLNIQQAVDAPRFHHQYLPDKLYLEPGFPPDTLVALRAMATTSASKTVSVQRRVHRGGPQNRRTRGGQDHRSHYGKAAGY